MKRKMEKMEQLLQIKDKKIDKLIKENTMLKGTHKRERSQ